MRVLIYILIFVSFCGCKTQGKSVATDKTKKDVAIVATTNEATNTEARNEKQTAIDEIADKTVYEVTLSAPDSTGIQHPTKLTITKTEAARKTSVSEKTQNTAESKQQKETKIEDKSKIDTKTETEKTTTHGGYSMLKQIGLWLGLAIFAVALIFGIKKIWK